MHFCQLDGRHGSAGAAAQLVRDVTPAGTTQHAAQGRWRARQHLAQALATRQGLLLDIADLRNCGQDLQQHGGLQAGTRWRRHVLQHQGGAWHGRRDSLEVRYLFGQRLELRWRGNHQRGSALRGRLLRQAQRLRRIGATDAHHHGHPSRHFLDHDACQPGTFGLAQSSHLAGHAGKGHPINAAAQQVTHQRGKVSGVGCAGGVKRGWQHREYPGDIDLCETWHGVIRRNAAALAHAHWSHRACRKRSSAPIRKAKRPARCCRPARPASGFYCHALA